MGNSGSFTEKALINPHLFVFTKWSTIDTDRFLVRGLQELSETFALRKHEFDYLLGSELVDYNTSRALFHDIFDLDGNNLVDKLEVMCVVCLTSALSNQDKLFFFFDLFNFNDKGYLYDSELTLLLLSITRGVFKVDQKYLPPSNKVITSLVMEAKMHAKSSKTSIRKPELVSFALGNQDVLSFLESWRGHASQVLLAAGEHWRDLTFPCHQESITPTHEWYNLGLPASSFVRWRRRTKAGSGLGYQRVFTHETTFLKTVDRRVVYGGDGMMGRGALRQGLLADGWILNALAAMVGRPDTLLSCLASTGQEDLGRFCTRFYEGTGWRAVNIDDRVPCGLDGDPLFCTSSHSLEAFPMLLEKGLAKYLGSYGHIGLCARRGDSTEMGLRMLTGAHVEKLGVKDFEWLSVDEEIKSRSGWQYVKHRLSEGSLVSIGRSEGMAMMDTRLPRSIIASKRAIPNHPPHGKLFPIVGNVFIEGFNYLILRDAFDLISDCDLSANYETGHCRTFKIKVDDVPFLFDSIIVGRFPDSLRILCDKLRLKPWRTDVIASPDSCIDKPAKFLLHVSKVDTSSIRSNPIRRMGNRADNLTVILNEADGKVASEVDKLLTLREHIDFSRVKLDKDSSRRVEEVEEKAGAKSAGPGLAGTSSEGGGGGQFDVKKIVGRNYNPSDDFVDVAITLSSSLDWCHAGATATGAKMRVVIRPSADTFELLQERDFQIDEFHRQASELAENKRLQAIKLELEMAAAANALSSAIPVSGSTSGDVSGRSPPTAVASLSSTSAQIDPPVIVRATTRRRAREEYDVVLTAERSWVSKSLLLFPGDYYVFADASFDLPYEVAFRNSIPAHLSEAPWLDTASPIYSSESKQQSRLTIIASKKVQAPLTSSSSSDIAAPLDSSSSTEQQRGNNSFGGSHPTDLSQQPRIYLQASSLESFHVKPLEDKHQHHHHHPTPIDTGIISLKSIPVPPETWPFSTEMQSEASSRYLINALARLKSDAVMHGVELLSLANQLRDLTVSRVGPSKLNIVPS